MSLSIPTISPTGTIAAETATGQPPHTYARRFGRTYRGLDNLTTASLCSRNVGKVRADCRLRVAKSQWGSLGALEKPAAIIYMDLAIDQPSNCRLESATVLITLEEASHSGIPCQNKPLQMTDYYGPKQLSGEATKVTVTRSVHLVPQVNVMGSGGGGLGVEREKSASYNTRWTFTGGLLAGEQMSPFYRTLKWELRENEVGARSNRSPVIHTAFALQHSDRPFIMRIEIQGRLQSSRDRFRQKMRFPRPNDSQQGRSNTLVYPNTVSARGQPLDMLAMGLSSAMERENLMRVPVEVPDALPISFSVDVDAATTTPRPGTPPFAQRTTDMPVKVSTEQRRLTRETTPELLLSPDDAASITGNRLASSVSNLSSASTLVNTPRTPLSRYPSSAILDGAIDSFNGRPRERSMWKKMPQQLQNLEIPRLKEPVSTPQDPTLVLLSRYPFLIFLLRIMAGVLDLMLGSQPSNDKTKNNGTCGGGETVALKPPYPGQWPQE
ncbi:hypothetical protein BJX68DRAFT_260988 [Aspergillus pseudodeflectus]|uniref:Uncharacterized protein n=1 Tax=Aspergillus pseudodeflectus TaxID=176178 RepID=A0ABR4L642_9EURO